MNKNSLHGLSAQDQLIARQQAEIERKTAALEDIKNQAIEAGYNSENNPRFVAPPAFLSIEETARRALKTGGQMMGERGITTDRPVYIQSVNMTRDPIVTVLLSFSSISITEYGDEVMIIITTDEHANIRQAAPGTIFIEPVESEGDDE